MRKGYRPPPTAHRDDNLSILNISNTQLQTPDGDTVTLGDYIDRATVVVLVRYFG